MYHAWIQAAACRYGSRGNGRLSIIDGCTDSGVCTRWVGSCLLGDVNMGAAPA